jgi:hypothetical protein
MSPPGSGMSTREKLVVFPSRLGLLSETGRQACRSFMRDVVDSMWPVGSFVTKRSHIFVKGLYKPFERRQEQRLVSALLMFTLLLDALHKPSKKTLWDLFVTKLLTGRIAT